MKAIKKLSFLAAAALIACPSGFTTLAADGTDGYRDVEPAAWYYEAVDWARVNGIIGGDVFEIVPLEPYPEDYDAIAERSQAELDGGILPEIAGSVENMDDYDTIILGFPIWYNDIPMIINTFIESYDLDGKTIAPFSTSGSDSISGALSTIEELCPEAEITEGLSIIGGELDSAEELAARWIDEIGIMDGETPDTSAETRRLKITVDGNEIYAELEDNATVDSLLEMLPLTQSFEDYNSTEKISYLEEKPETENDREAYDPETGDLCLYEPWGNLCFFYGDAGASGGLVPIAHVEDGMDIIAGIAGGTEMTIELA